MNREQRAALAQETLSILEKGFYVNNDGVKVDIEEDLNRCKQNTILYKPNAFDSLQEKLSDRYLQNKPEIEVTPETTLKAASRLVTEEKYKQVACLNFASAKKPGGGFLSGSQAQEESLARSSGLFASLQEKREYYDQNKTCGTALYSDHLIFSPDVPVFRDDSGELLNDYYLVSILTAPAVNAGAVRKNEPHNIEKIQPAMKQRTRNVLSVAAYHQCDTLVSGAWGCGVFQNDPNEIADIWFRQTVADDFFHGKFRKIVYAVFDSTKDRSIFRAFADRFKR